MELGVQHIVLHAVSAQVAGQPLGLFNGDGADQDRLPTFVAVLNFLDDRREFFFFRPEDDVGVILADHRPVGRHDVDVQIVDLGELSRFRVGRAGHAGQLLVHTEVVLEGDGGQGLVLVGDLDAFFGFHGLVQPVAPPAARHQPAGKLIDDDDFAVLDHIVDIALVE
jgi:hypothetical protein